MTIIAIYKYKKLWSEETTRHLLGCFKAVIPGAFPVMLPTGVDQDVAIEDGSNDSWAVIPKTVLVDPVFLSFHGRDGTRIEVAQTTRIGVRPGSVIISLAQDRDCRLMWDLVNLASHIEGELGIAADRTLLARMHSRGLEVDGSLVPLAIGNVNFWCDEWVRRFSAEQISALQTRSSRFEQSAAGLAFEIQEGTAIRSDDKLLEVEELIGLSAVHERYRKSERKSERLTSM